MGYGLPQEQQIPLYVCGIIITLIGIILNLLIFGLYIRIKSIPRSFANKLLLHQCFVDLVNLVVLILPVVCQNLYLLSIDLPTDYSYGWCMISESCGRYGERIKFIRRYLSHFLPLSAFSSALTFMLEAVDRLITNHSKNLYEKFNKKKVMIPTILILWTVSMSFSICLSIAWETENFDKMSYLKTRRLVYKVFEYSLALIMFLNTFLIDVAIYKSHKKLKEFRSSIDPQAESQNMLESVKRDFRLTLIFLIMYLIYIVPAIGLYVGLYVNNQKMFLVGDTYSFLIIYSLSIASTLNPIITLTLKKDFRRTQVRSIN